MTQALTRKNRQSKIVPSRPRASDSPPLDKGAAIALLNGILEHELAGALQFTHCSLVVFGEQRRSLVHWLRDQADEALRHARKAGELVTHLGELPSLGIAAIPDTHELETPAMLARLLEHEETVVDLYRQLLAVAKDRSVLLEEFARSMVQTEELHAGEIVKMLRTPGGH